MKAVICRSPGELVVEDRSAPSTPPPGWALVAVSHVGICGTDYHIFEGKHPFLAYPRIMGHEVSGTVIEAGEGVDLAVGEPVIINPYLACGKCIACRQGKPNCCVRIEVLGVHRDGAMCERILVPAQNLYPTNGLSLADAAAVEFLAIGAHAVRRSLADPGARALVIGAGPIGLGTALFARIAGLEVTLLDMSAERLGFAASELGFATLDGSRQSATDLVREATNGEGFDVIFDATGNTQSVQSAFAHVAHGGTLVLVSVVKDDIVFSDPEFHKREMTLIGSRNALRADFDHVTASIRDGAVPLAKLVTHRTTLGDTPRDLARWAHAKSGLIKAVIQVG
ncbi:MAG: zinc-binding alcohol dehydrogenase family protein [Mesorhizobium sp.]|uniref:zinc-binding alcohol dehydrogenase family protein n=1 Tax=Mesorhizobium sp. TaxID=1871066 RepID=UPI0011F605B1|nr:zinc-binding alcohol dehydrogenase family protein [Mesorhizobium sp.]TIL71588.1 MAG: zinc-binding alcohol dehydrogenase family protein [Mesorhizobium sp.]TIL86504.1 MAG: zinc-binding alcohol dehydrogenase family protein [Mesorhizobium sp.]TIL98286.1 MAG: zinc-binding alcohol dehydrogenase family protein [Mesorhizobium sp.]